MVKSESVGENNIVLRTVLREDVYEKLELYAKSLSTGRGHWDFGVAIEKLLDLNDLRLWLQELESRVDDVEAKQLQTDDVSVKPTVGRCDEELDLLGPRKRLEDIQVS